MEEGRRELGRDSTMDEERREREETVQCMRCEWWMIGAVDEQERWGMGRKWETGCVRGVGRWEDKARDEGKKGR